jgi:hypothetical protein
MELRCWLATVVLFPWYAWLMATNFNCCKAFDCFPVTSFPTPCSFTSLAKREIGNSLVNICCRTQSSHVIRLMKPKSRYDVTSTRLFFLHHHHERRYQRTWSTRTPQITTSNKLIRLSLSKTNNDDIWKQQKELVNQMKEKQNSNNKEIAMQKYRQRAQGLVKDTTFISFLLFCFLWMIQENPWVPISYLLGTTCGIAYTFGLSKYVETVGQTVDDVMKQDNTPGTGFGAARFAFLIILFILVGQYRSYGLLEIPSIFGFFTYQIASLSQGLRDIND